VLPALRVAPAVGDDGVLHAVATAGQLRAWHLPAHWPGARVSTPSGLSTLAVSPDGTEVALGGSATNVARWRIADGSVRWDVLVDGVVKGFAWGADGLRATISGSNTTMLLTPDGPVVDRLRPTAYRRLGVLPDGRLIAIPYDSAPVVWNDAAGREDVLSDVPECYDLGIGPDGAALLDREGGVWRLDGVGIRPARQALLADARAVDAGPNGRTVVAASDRLLVLGPSGDTAFEAPLDGRTVMDVAWSPDGALLATGNLDGTADLWRAEDGALVATLAGHTDRVAALEFSPDGSWLVTASWDQSARRWSLDPVLSPPSPADVEARWGASLADVEHDGRDEDGSDGPIEGARPSP
jgi:WD40 repeat protein